MEVYPTLFPDTLGNVFNNRYKNISIKNGYFILLWCKVIHLSLKMNLVSHKMSKTPLRSSSEMWRARRIRFSFYLPLQGIQNNVCPYKETNDSKQISSEQPVSSLLRMPQPSFMIKRSYKFTPFYWSLFALSSIL